MKAIILAGGKGTRLRSVVSDVPKPMAPVDKRPFLEYVIGSLAAQGMREIILSVGHQKEIIRSHFRDGSRLGVHISYSEEDSPLGTGGAIREAIRGTAGSRFLILNGDTFNRLDHVSMEAFHLSTGALLTIALVMKRNAGRYGLVTMDEHRRIIGFSEKACPGGGYINCGVYMAERAIVDLMPEGAFSLEKDLFPSLTGGAVYGYPGRHFFIDIGIPATYRYIDHHPALLRPFSPAREAWNKELQ